MAHFRKLYTYFYKKKPPTKDSDIDIASQTDKDERAGGQREGHGLHKRCLSLLLKERLIKLSVHLSAVITFNILKYTSLFPSSQFFPQARTALSTPFS